MNILPVRSVVSAVVIATLGCFGSLSLAGPETEPLYFVYHGQQKALTLDVQHIAVRVSAQATSTKPGALPESLVSRGFASSDVVTESLPGWKILDASNALAARQSSQPMAPSGKGQDASVAIHTLVTSLLTDPSIEFVSPVFRDSRGGPIILTSRIMIGFEKDFPETKRQLLRSAVVEGASLEEMEFPQAHDQRWQLNSRDGFEVLARANALAQLPDVAYAEPDMIITGYTNLVPSDPGFVQSWGLRNTGQSGGAVGFDMRATAAWDVTLGSSSVIVLVMDSGVQQNHPDINQITGKDFTSDSFSNPNGGPVGPNDNHGTWVAGCISEKINNSLGSAGIAPGVKVASARCGTDYHSDGSFFAYDSWFADALYWGQSIGARVSNNSNVFGAASNAVDSAYSTTLDGGMIHFAAAGNSGLSYLEYPATSPWVNAVGAANRFGQRSSFSQYGYGLKFLAPGEAIYTTDRTGSMGLSGDYAIVSGTSFASPYAAGVAALIISQNPGLNVDAIKVRMQNSCEEMGPPGYDTGYGYGMLNAFRAVTGTAPPRITSNLTPLSVLVGDNFAYQITANNNPASFSATGLPTGLQLDTATGLISGVPTVFGTFPVEVTASQGTDTARATVTIVIDGPHVTSSGFSSPAAGDMFSYQIASTNNPTSYDATGLPPGLQIDRTLGRVSGIPAVAGTFYVTLIAHTAFGDATLIWQLVVRPPYITNLPYYPYLKIGDEYSYQATANVSATSYSVVGLPAGLQFDPQTGLITGVPTLSGNYMITVIAHTPNGDATGIFFLSVLSQPTPDMPAKTFALSSWAMIADPQRPHIYMATPYGIAVLNTETLSVTQTIPVDSPGDISISTDGSKLWYTRYGQRVIGAVDLETLTLLPEFTLPASPSQIREGLQGRLYVTAYDLAWAIYQIDSSNGAVQSQFSPATAGWEGWSYLIEVSPDKKNLYAGAATGAGAPSARYDISNSTPVLGERVVLNGGCQSIAVSHDGQKVCFVPWNPSYPYTSFEFSASNLTASLGGFPWSEKPWALGFNPNDSVVFQGAESQPKIGAFNAQTFALQRTFTIPNANGVSSLVVDYSNTYLVAALRGSGVVVYRLRSQSSNVPPRSLINVSTRTFVQTGDNVEIGGFIIQGDQPKKIVVRAIGPTLSQYGLSAISDPVVELHDSTGALVATNDNWNSHRQEVLQTGLSPGDEHEAVIVATLPPGAYTAIVRGLNGAIGTALFELFDIDPANSKIANISTRAKVGTGDNVMIGGFIVGGDQPTSVIVRAIGPSLTQYGVTDAMIDPVLELHDSTGALVAQNNDWQSDQQSDISNTGLAPGDTHESVILATLAPGSYTAIVRGKNNTAGIALVEVYNLSH